MVTLVVASLTQLIPSWWAYMLCWIALAVVTVYFCWASRATVGYGKWRKSFLSLCCLIFLLSMSYAQIKSRYQEENVIPPQVSYLKGWGPVGSAPLSVTGDPPRVVGGIPSSAVNVDGRLLDKYKKRFQLMAVVLHVINGESYVDKGNLSKSKLMRIRPEDMLIKVDYNQQFLAESETGVGSNTFVLLAIPKGMRPEDFDTLNDAEDKGAEIIGEGTAANINSQTPAPGMQPSPKS
jgi:hypothetical protein